MNIARRIASILLLEPSLDANYEAVKTIPGWPPNSRAQTFRPPAQHREAREAMNIARRIAAILFLELSIDANYQAIKNATYPWSID